MSATKVPAIPSVAQAAPDHTGMGAIPYDQGVTFRVWLLFADSVSVVGEFNKWTPLATPMARDGNSNYWSVNVPGAKAGQGYKFYVPMQPIPATIRIAWTPMRAPSRQTTAIF